MAIVTSDFLAGVRTTFSALYEKEFAAAAGLQGWRQLVLETQSDSEIESYNWFGTVPVMQNVTHGTVELAGLRPDNFSLTNQEFQSAIEVERAALERDKLMLIRPRITQLSLEAARHPGELIMKHVLNNDNAYDGSAYFANSRTIGGSATIDNILVGTGTTIAQIQTDLATAKGQMRKFQDDQGRPMNLQGNTIMVPSELDDLMWQALNRSAGDNVNTPVQPVTTGGIWSSSGYSVIVNPYLTDANDWYLFHVGAGDMRPFIFQVEKRPVLESDTNPNDRNTILARTFVYSVYGRYQTGMTDPRLGIQTTNS